jgi:copper resistance protein C
MNLRLRAAWLAVWALCHASSGFAHAFLDHAAPAVGSTVRAPPAQVRLWFSQELEPAFSTIRVLDLHNARQDKNDVTVDARDSKILQVSLAPLPPGRYRVEWRVLSVDTHVTEGGFTFDIAP